MNSAKEEKKEKDSVSISRKLIDALISQKNETLDLEEDILKLPISQVEIEMGKCNYNCAMCYGDYHNKTTEQRLGNI